MSVERIECEPRMSMATLHGGVAYLAGQVAERAPGAPAAEQTRDVLAWIDEFLAAAGTDKSRLLSATIYLADRQDGAAVNGVWEAWLPAGCAPARATVEARLASADYRVEIVVTAALR